MYCPICGNKVPSDAAYCAHCGAQLNGNENSSRGSSGKTPLRVFVLFGVLVVFFFGIVLRTAVENNHTKVQAVVTPKATVATKGIWDATPKPESKNNGNTDAQPTKKPEEKVALPDYSDRQHVYVRDIMRDYRKYEGIGCQVYVAGLSDIRVFHDKVYCNADSENELDLQANVYRESMDEYYDFSNTDEEFIIGGVVAHEGEGKDKKVILDRAVIIRRLNTDDAEYQNMKAAYEETLRQDVIRKESDFKANAVKVTYNDLLRYPDSWKDKPVYMTLRVNEVKVPTGFFDAALNGTTYLCVVPGTNNEVLVSDIRDIKEPTIMEGDTISFYGTPDGLGSIRIYDPDKLFNNTIDRYEVPRVNIWYM